MYKQTKTTNITVIQISTKTNGNKNSVIKIEITNTRRNKSCWYLHLFISYFFNPIGNFNFLLTL